MSTYEIVSSGLLLLTLLVLVIYTAKTATIARAAVEQSEAAQKPCLVPKIPQALYWTLKPDTKLSGGDIDWKHGVPSPDIENIGSGPALKVTFSVEPDSSDAVVASPIPFVKPGATPQTRCISPLSGMVRHRISYESMSGTKYETTVVVEDGQNVDFTFRRRG